jgi:predicted GH43/DUF377 family glycosyl hydrolase
MAPATAADIGRMRRAILVAILAVLAAPGVAQACSKDDATFYETFLDTTCLQVPLTNTTLDALGGLRLATNGTPTTTPWDTDADFNSGVSYQGNAFGSVGVRTLATNGSGTSASLQLPTTLLPLTLDHANPVLSPAEAVVGDNDGVDDPTVAKVGSAYVMWYSGTAEDGSGPAIFMATSTNGVGWTRANGGNPVLEGTAGAFDADGVYAPDVSYDPTDTTTPYRMYYSGKSSTFGGIGYATSVDGVTWLQYKGPTGLFPTPVVDHGSPGSADSFSAADPSVMKDGSVWKMWYTGDDSNKKRIAYATSSDGVNWAKGGKVIAPEDPGVSANIAFGAFAPTVWKTTTGYSMLLTGRKLVSGSTFQTKIMSTTSSDGISWSGPSPALNPSGTNSNFDFSNLNSPDLLEDPGSASPYKLYYSGNTIDANGNFHTRIGVATSSDGKSFGKVTGSQTGGSVLDVGTAGSAFDGRQASGLSVVAPAGASPKFVGFYWGTRGSDFKPRLGLATSTDGSAWTKVSVSAPNGGALFGLGNPAAFDNGGERDPSVLYDSGTYDLYLTGISSGGTRTIGLASTPEIGATKQPDNTAWSARAQALGTGSGWDAGGVSHPSVIKDGSTYVLYYTGADSSGVAKIGRATATAAGGPFTRDAGNPLLTLGAGGSFDEKGVKDPVVVKLGASDYRMLYTGVDANGTERVGYATSADGVSWTKRGVVLNPSQIPYTNDESGVEPTGMLLDGSTLHVWTSGIDRTSRTHADHATSAYPTPASPSSGIPGGWATYQLGDSTTTVADFRQIARTSSGDGVSLWVSFLQPYSAAGNEFWSAYFPVTGSSTSQALNFLLTVHGIRWQARLSEPGGGPALDKVEITHAPVSFFASGSASSSTITPSAGRIVTAWRSLTANTSLFTPNGSGTGQATATVLDAATNQTVAAATLNTGGDTVLDLSGVSASAHQALQVRLDVQSADAQATPLVNWFKVVYDSAPTPPPPPPPPPAPSLTFSAAPKTIVYGKSLTLSGVLTQGGAPLSAKAVLLFDEPVGKTTFAALAPATTGTTGSFSRAVKPTMRTTYKASFAGAPDVLVSVLVKHLVTLSVVKKGGKAYFRGKIGPRHPKRLVVIQVRKGSRWVTFAKVRTTKRSTFLLVKALKPGVHYKVRARTGADMQHLAGVSRVVRL